MKEFQFVIYKFLKNHEKHKKYLALLTVLSLVVSMAVPFSLIMPAISMTGGLSCGMEEHTHSGDCYALFCGQEESDEHLHNQDCYALICSNPEHIHTQECYTSDKNDSNSLFENIFPEAMNINNVADDATDMNFDDFNISTALDLAAPNIPSRKLTATHKVTGSTSSGNKLVTFNLAYNIEAGATLNSNQRYVYYKITDENVRIKGEAQHGTVFDGSIVAGYYYIDNNGLIKIKFREKYLSDNKSNIEQNGIKGTLSFDAEVSRSEGNRGDQEVGIGESTLTIPFDTQTLNMTKTGELDKANHKIKWTVQINNDTDESLSGKVITDKMFNGCQNLTVKKSDGTSVNFTPTGDTIKFADDVDLKRSVINIEYETVLTAAEIKDILENKNKKLTNNVSMVDQGETITVPEEVTFSDMITINKTGKADFNDPAVTDNNNIIWEIELKNEYGLPLGTNTIYDSMFKGKTLAQLKEMIESGIDESKIGTSENSDIYFDSASGTLKIKNVNETSLTIKYSAPAGAPEYHYTFHDDQNKKQNYYKLNDENEKHTDVNYKPFDLNKSGSPNYNKGTIDWTINITVADGTPSLNGYKIKDDAFAGLDVSKLNFTNGITAAKDSSDADGKTIILSGSSGSTTVTYSVPLTAEELKQASVSKDNKMELLYPGGKKYGEASSQTVTYTPTSDIGKSLTSGNPTSGVVNDDHNKETLSWEIKLTNDAGFQNKEVSDKMSIASESGAISDETKVSHTISKSQGDAMQIVMKKTNESGAETKTLTNGNGFTIKYYSDEAMTNEVTLSKDSDSAKYFKVIFDNKKEYTDYRFATITYNTTADLSGIVAGKKVTFKNDSEFNDKTSNSSYDFTRAGNTVIKTLSGNSSESGAVDKDTAEKKLSWKIDVTPGGEFSGNILVDNIGTSGTGGEHYITKATSNIKVTAFKTGETSGTLLDNAGNKYYTVKYYNQSGAEVSGNDDKAVKFEIIFNSDIDTDKYRKVEVTYDTTAKLQGIGAGESVKFQNGATFGGTPSKDTPEYSFTRTDTTIDKTLKNPANAQEDGTVDFDTKTKELQWQIALRPGTDVTSYNGKFVYDSLSAKNNGEHYILPSQASAIKVYTTNKEDKSNLTALTSDSYKIHYYSDASHTSEITNFSGDAKALSFGIEFIKDIGTPRFVIIDYKTTADLSKLTVNQQGIFENTSEFNNKTDKGEYKFTRKAEGIIEKTLKTTTPGSGVVTEGFENPVADWSIKLHPGIDGFNSHDLTDNLSGAGGGKHYITPAQRNQISLKGTPFSSADSTIASGKYTITFYDQSGAIISSDDTTTNAYKFSIKFDESLNELYRDITVEYKTTADVSEINVNETGQFKNKADFGPNYSSEETYEFKSDESSFNKTALDKNGADMPKENASRLVSDIVKKKFNAQGIEDANGTEYYVFTWRIRNFAPTDIVKDTLPPGFTLCNDGQNTGWLALDKAQSYYAHPLVIYPTNWGAGLNYFGKSVSQTTNSDGRVEVTFPKIDENTYYICYSAKIPVADLDAKLATTGYDITNSAEFVNRGASVESKQTITKSSQPDVPVEESLLDKEGKALKDEFNGKLIDGKVTYGVDFNPTGKTLSNGVNILLKDIITIGDYKNEQGASENYSSDDVNIELTNINVYEVNGMEPVNVMELLDPEADKGTPISNFASIFNMKNTEKVEVKNIEKSDSANSYKFPAKSGDKITFSMDIENHDQYNLSDIHFRFFTKDGEEIQNLLTDAITGKTGKNTISYTFTIPYNTTNDKIVETADIYDWKAAQHNTWSNFKVSIERQLENPKGEIELTVPDSKHLYIEYTYVINKRKTNSKGEVIEDNGKIMASNSISIESGFFTATDSADQIEIGLEKSGASASTSGGPTIYKTNVGKTNIKDLIATFKLARYKNGKWEYATGFTATSTGDDSPHKINSWSDNASAAGTFDTTAKGYNIINDDSSNGNFGIEEKVLYKLIETKAPAGYQSLLNFEYYFIYNGTISDVTLPADVSPNSVKSAKGDIEVSNNDLININAKKVLADTNNSEISSVDLTIYWSYENKPGAMASDLHELSELGLTIDATKTIGISTGENNIFATWTDLPNGYNEKPIYYYIKETAYTIGTEKYELKSDGSYKCGEKIGQYSPSYSSNSINDDRDEDHAVVVTNSKSLTVKKAWQNPDQSPMNKSKIPATEIKCVIYGQNTIPNDPNRKQIGEPFIISAENDWQFSNFTGYDFGDYKYYVVSETEIKLKGETAFKPISCLYGEYTYGDSLPLDSSKGVITVENRLWKSSSDTDVSVVKKWADGNDNHSSDSVEVKLYYSTEGLSLDQIANLSKDSIPESLTPVPADFVKDKTIENPVTLNNGTNNWTYTWEGLPYKPENATVGQKYYYYVIETSDLGDYVASYSWENKNSTHKTTIVNSIPGSISITKNWDPETEKDKHSLVKFELYRKTQTQTQTVLGRASITKPSNLNVMATGDSITYGFGAESDAYPIYLKKYLNEIGKYSNADVANNGHNCYKIEDIQGTLGSLNSSYQISTVIAGTNNLLNTNDTMDQMETKMESLLDEIYKKTDSNHIVLLGGIPKLGSVNSWDRDGYEEYTAGSKDALKKKWDTLVSSYNTMIENLVTKYSANHKIYYVDIESAVGDNLQDDGIHPNATGYQNIATAFYNAINEYYTTGTVTGTGTGTGSTGQTNTNAPENTSTLTSDFWSSAEKITSNVVDGNKVSGLNSDGTFTITSDENWSKNITNLPVKDALGNEYVYYLKEISVDDKNLSEAGFTSSFTGNGQKPGSSTPIAFTNTKVIPKTSITFNKVWNGSELDSVTVQIYQADTPNADRSTWQKVEGKTITLTAPTWSGMLELEKYDNVYYYAEEILPDGYAVDYTNNNGHNGDSSDTDRTIIIRNTEAFSMSVKKEWSDINKNEHISDTVKARVYRSTNPDSNGSANLIFAVTSDKNITLSQNNTRQIETNKTSGVTYTSSNPSVVSVSDTGLIKAEAKNGTAVITVKYGNQTETIDVTVSELLSVSANDITIDVNQSKNLTVSNAVGNVTISGINSNIATAVLNGSEIQVTGVAVGETSFTVKDTSNAPAVTVTVHVNPAFAVDNVELFEGDSATLNPNKTDKSITYEIPDNAKDIITISGNNLTASSVTEDKEFSVKAKYSDGIECTFNVKVKNFAIENGDSADINVGGTLQLNTNKTTGVTWSAPENSKILVSASGEVTLSASAQAGDKAVITATDKHGNTDTIEITVIEAKEFTIYKNGKAVDSNTPVIVMGTKNPITFTTNKDIDSLSSNDNYQLPRQINNDKRSFTVEADYAFHWTISITVTSADKQTFTLKINYQEFTPLSITAPSQLAFGGNATLSSNKDNTTYEIISGSEFIDLSGDTVTAKSTAGTATIRATCGDETKDFDIEIVAEAIADNNYVSSDLPKTVQLQSGKTVQNIQVTVNHVQYGWEYIQVKFDDNNYIKAGWYGDNGFVIEDNNTKQTDISGSVSANGNVGTLTITLNNANYTSFVVSKANQEPSGTVKVNYADAQTASLMSLAPMSLMLDTAPAAHAEPVREWHKDAKGEYTEIEITSTDTSWTKLLNNLEVVNSDGEKYYYWVEETDVSSSYEVSYKFEDGDSITPDSDKLINADNAGDSIATIRNTYTESDETAMPETGGTGTEPYKVIGLVLACGALTVLGFRKRRKA